MNSIFVKVHNCYFCKEKIVKDFIVSCINCDNFCCYHCNDKLYHCKECFSWLCVDCNNKMLCKECLIVK